MKGRLRAAVGEDVYSSWFARMDLECIQDNCVRMSVPTKFLKSWIQAHYVERVMECWQAEMADVNRVDLTVRTAMRPPVVVKDVKTQIDDQRRERTDHRPMSGLRAVATAPTMRRSVPAARSRTAA